MMDYYNFFKSMVIKIFGLCLLAIPFSLTGQYQTTGNASTINDSCFIITPNTGNQKGAVWTSNQINLSQSFELQLSYYFGVNTGGADGMTFSIQPNATALGTGTLGAFLGMASIAPSLIIEFDTYQNSEFADPFFHHTALLTNGTTNHNLTNNLAGPISLQTNNAAVSNGVWHNVLIQWIVNANNTQTIRMYFNCVLRIDHTANFISQVFNNNPMQRWGVTGATGGLTNLQQVCIVGTNATGGAELSYEICEGETVEIAAVNSGTGFSWSPGGSLSDSTVANPVASPLETTTYIVEYTGLCNENYVDTIVVEVFPETEVIIQPIFVPDVCLGGSVQFIALASDTNAQFTWYPEASLSCSDCPMPIATPTETTTYYVSSNCSNIDSITIIVSDPLIDLVDNETICQGGSIQLGLFHDDSTTYSWSASSGETLPPIGNPTVNPDQTTTYIVQATIGSCTITDTVTITVIELPELSISTNQASYCTGDVIQLTANTSLNTGITWTGAGLLSNSGLNVMAAPSTAGNYTYTVAATFQGCDVQDEITLTVDDEPEIDIIANTSICQGESIVLGNSHNPDYEYSWTATGVSDIPEIGNPEVQPLQTTTYNLLVSNGGCSQDAAVTITVISLQVSAADDLYICEGETVQLSAITTSEGANGNTIVWEPSDGLSCTDCLNPTANPDETTTYSVTFSLDGNCPVQDEITVFVGPPITVSILDNATISPGSSVNLSSNVQSTTGGNPGELTYIWSPPTGLSCTDCPNPVASPTTTTTYQLEVTSEFGCEAVSNEIEIVVEAIHYAVPNAFTPDGDNINDRFTVIFPEGANIMVRKLEIFNRWGKLIYADAGLGYWDGKYNGALAPQDVYVYKIELALPDGSVEVIHGDVTILH
jgi:gliding motility-associated-like protein